jgi:hypothetical protein
MTTPGTPSNHRISPLPITASKAPKLVLKCNERLPEAFRERYDRERGSREHLAAYWHLRVQGFDEALHHLATGGTR